MKEKQLTETDAVNFLITAAGINEGKDMSVKGKQSDEPAKEEAKEVKEQKVDEHKELLDLIARQNEHNERQRIYAEQQIADNARVLDILDRVVPQQEKVTDEFSKILEPYLKPLQQKLAEVEFEKEKYLQELEGIKLSQAMTLSEIKLDLLKKEHPDFNENEIADKIESITNEYVTQGVPENVAKDFVYYRYDNPAGWLELYNSIHNCSKKESKKNVPDEMISTTSNAAPRAGIRESLKNGSRILQGKALLDLEYK